MASRVSEGGSKAPGCCPHVHVCERAHVCVQGAGALSTGLVWARCDPRKEGSRGMGGGVWTLGKTQMVRAWLGVAYPGCACELREGAVL